MVARSKTGEVKCYPVVETEQRDSICHTVTVPARVSPAVTKAAQALAMRAVRALGDGATGVFGVEMFLLKDGSVVFNEVAPRPHNSGHYTIEACHTDQFEQHLRAILGLPLGDCSLKVGAAVMQNVLGTGDMAVTQAIFDRALTIPGATNHWYGKGEDRKGRKLGHITCVGPTLDTVLNRVRELNQEPQQPARPVSEASMWAQHAAMHADRDGLSSIGPRACLVLSLLLTRAHTQTLQLVGIIMGSDSDLPCMADAARFLVGYNHTLGTALPNRHGKLIILVLADSLFVTHGEPRPVSSPVSHYRRSSTFPSSSLWCRPTARPTACASTLSQPTPVACRSGHT